jgi:hypothetical protein
MAARQIAGAAREIGDICLIDKDFRDATLFDGCLIGAGPDPEGWT